MAVRPRVALLSTLTWPLLQVGPDYSANRLWSWDSTAVLGAICLEESGQVVTPARSDGPSWLAAT